MTGYQNYHAIEEWQKDFLPPGWTYSRFITNTVPLPAGPYSAWAYQCGHQSRDGSWHALKWPADWPNTLDEVLKNGWATYRPGWSLPFYEPTFTFRRHYYATAKAAVDGAKRKRKE